MNGMITTNEHFNFEEIKPKLAAYATGDVVSKVTCQETVLKGKRKKGCTFRFWCKEEYCKIS